MKKAISTVNYFEENFGMILLVFIAISFPFKIIYGSIAIIVALLYSIYKVFFKKNTQFHSFNTFTFWFPLIFFTAALISAVTSNNYSIGLDQIFKRLPVIFLPFILFSLVDRKDTLNKILTAFTISLTISTFILLVAFIVKFLEGVAFKDLVFHDYSAFLNQHPVYFSLFIALSIFFITKELMLKENVFKTKSISTFSIIILLSGMILASSKAVLTAFILLYLIQWLSFFKKVKIKLIIIGIFITGFFLIFNYTHIKGRFYEGLSINKSLNFNPSPNFKNIKKFSSSEKRQISDLELRIIFFKIGFYHTVYDHKYWFGYGLGDVQDNLDYYYMKYNLAPNWYEKYNLHNQYLQFFATYGIFMVLFFLSFLVYSLLIAFKNKDNLYILFLVLLFFVFTFEVLLARNKGILFFYFFNTIFLINNIKFENSHTRNQRNP